MCYSVSFVTQMKDPLSWEVHRATRTKQ